MSDVHRVVQPAVSGDRARLFRVEKDGTRVIRTAEGYPLEVPGDWALLEPGDAMLTRRVKAAVSVWVMQERKGRRTMSRGVWAPAAVIEKVRGEVAAARAEPGYQKKLDAGRARRAEQEAAYAGDFESAIVAFLAFAPRHGALAAALARRVAAHAVPVGSGTVARTRRISIEERAKAAVIAWMRHHTTAYDRLHIPRVKGKRREVRRRLAKQSVAVLTPYREGGPVPAGCPLSAALSGLGVPPT
ncbi:MAG: DUF2293 domain-containing protein [Phycisphaerales bacterium JB063]